MGTSEQRLESPQGLRDHPSAATMPSGAVAKSHHLFVSSFLPGKLELLLLLPISKFKNKLG